MSDVSSAEEQKKIALQEVPNIENAVCCGYPWFDLVKGKVKIS